MWGCRVWASSRRWWRIEKPGVLQSMGSQRAGHDWATEQQEINYLPHCIIFYHLTSSLVLKIFISEFFLGLSWWPRGEGFTCQCRKHGFTPWSGKIPHAVEQLNPCTTTIEPVPKRLGAATTEACAARACALQQEKPPQWDAHTLQLESSPQSTRYNYRKSLSSNEDPVQPKINKYIKF